MTRRSAKVVILHRDSFSMVDDWIDHIEVRRDANARFAVWGNKYGENPMTGSRRWGEWEKTKGLTSPISIYKAIEDLAMFLNVQVEWVDAIPLIASIDWLTAAVIAEKVGFEVPALPDVDTLITQRSLRTLGSATIGAEWGYGMHDLTLTYDRWIKVVQGKSVSIDKPYFYEGQRFIGTWVFGPNHELEVSYGDGGVGWTGKLGDLDLTIGPELDGVDIAKLALKASLF